MQQAIAILTMVLALIGAGPTVAQQIDNLPTGQVELGKVLSPILTIDRDLVFRNSAFGRRAASEHEDRLQQLEKENEAVVAALEAEEKELTTKRDTMEPDAFRALADAFDDKVQAAEQAQLSKNRELIDAFERERATFRGALDPVLELLIRESDALIVLDRRVVLAGISEIDITDRAIALLDETIGAGKAPE